MLHYLKNQTWLRLPPTPSYICFYQDMNIVLQYPVLVSSLYEVYSSTLDCTAALSYHWSWSCTIHSLDSAVRCKELIPLARQAGRTFSACVDFVDLSEWSVSPAYDITISFPASSCPDLGFVCPNQPGSISRNQARNHHQLTSESLQSRDHTDRSLNWHFQSTSFRVVWFPCAVLLHFITHYLSQF